MTDAEGAPTLRALLGHRGLGLVVLAGDDLDVEVRGVHSSDLADPTPFLSDGLALLTTGTQFAVDGADEEYDAYVARLAGCGVVALGFGTEVVRAGVPPSLVAACRRWDVPLFEVPYRTPFIAVARANAESIAARAYARRGWALAAQHSIALAALRPDGLRATVAELSHQLRAWVGLFDATGALAHDAGIPERGDAAWARATELLRGRRVAAVAADLEGGRQLVLQTLGRGGHLRGVLAVAGPHLDAEGRTVVAAVAAMAALALEQSGAVRGARGAVRAAALRLLIAGDPHLAASIATEVGGIPDEPVRVGTVVDAPETADEWLDSRADGGFSGRLDDELVLLVAGRDAAIVEELAEELGLVVGLSAPIGLHEVAEGLRQARAGARRVPRGVGRFEASGVLAASSTDDARLHAASLTAPLMTHDAAHGTDLVATLRAWLDEDGGNDRAAQRLGVHRHTVRSRVALAERVLGRSLADFPARAELWLALRLTAG